MIGYSPKFPLQINNKVGAYGLNLSIREVIAQNYKNLLLTAPGERIMDSNFGVGLRHYLFELNTSSTSATIAQNILDQTTTYFPLIKLESILFNEGVDSAEENLILNIAVRYSMPGGGSNVILVGQTTPDI